MNDRGRWMCRAVAGAIVALSASVCAIAADGDASSAQPQSDPAAAASRPPAATVDLSKVAALVTRLGDPQWATREEAEKELAALGAAVLPVLDTHLATVTDPEVLRRLERVYRMFTPQTLYAGDDQRPGFLGVQLGLEAINNDPRLRDRENGITVVGVVADTAAEKAGLEEGDMIVSLNGKKFLGDFSIDHFKVRIQCIGAGGKVRIGLFRGPTYMELDAVLMAGQGQVARTVRVVGPNGVVEQVEITGVDERGSDPRVLDYRWGVWWCDHVKEVAKGAAAPNEKPAGQEKPETAAPSGDAKTTSAASDSADDKEKP